jgi:hypothetical protein
MLGECADIAHHQLGLRKDCLIDPLENEALRIGESHDIGFIDIAGGVLLDLHDLTVYRKLMRSLLFQSKYP